MIFLGAGASASEGAPLQGGIFQYYFESLKNSDEIRVGQTQWHPEKAIPTFFDNVFGVDFGRNDPKTLTYPTFEEALGILDIAINRQESFGKFSYSLGDRPTNYPTIHQIRSILIDVLTLVLSECNVNRKGIHDELCRNLKSGGLLPDVLFATTNYDTFIDNGLKTIHKTTPVNYACNFDLDSYQSSTSESTTLLKIHGSLNWFFCKTCGAVIHVSDSEIYNLRFGKQCKQCNDFIHPLIVPPTFFKDMSHSVLSSVWHFFQNSLHDVSHIIFCGYSFPDADLHIKYALKHQELVFRKKIKVTVINEHKGKSKTARDEEFLRFERFFSSQVDYTTLSFEDFALSPEKVITT